MAKKLSVENIKENSLGLRGHLQDALQNGATHLDEENRQLIKFHGIYQQDNRDVRRDNKKQGLEPAYDNMVRTKVPGGILSAEQYLVLDQLADTYGNGALRATNRQDIQLHGVLKHNLQDAVQTINQALMTTLGACGDVVRNVVCCPAPHKDRALLQEYCQALTQRFLPRSSAYHEIWLNGKNVSGQTDEIIYGNVYLPRKFKIGLTFPHDNCIEVHTNDVGLVAIVEDQKIKGFNVYAGGSLGMSHGKSDTYPRLASPIGYVSENTLLDTVEAIITIQRDFGNRENRLRARLKYLLDERGEDWFKAELHKRLSFELAPLVETEPFAIEDHLGWNKQENDQWYVGLHVENGRIQDTDTQQLRTALRTVVQTYKPGFRITSQQNILLTHIDKKHITDIENIFQDYGVPLVAQISLARRWSMACPAMPTCGLAITESERVLPSLIDQIETELENLDLEGETITMRMTGCANGCARPYTAELAFIGRSREKYAIHIGGSLLGTRLTQEYADLIHFDDIVPTLRPLFEQWKTLRLPDEKFGDFCFRMGIKTLQKDLVTA